MVIKVLNLDKCIKKFKNIGNIDLSKPIREGTQRVQSTAKALCPVDTGYLRSSINRQPLGSYKYGGIVFTPVEYAIYQEYGTVKMLPKSFMRPALMIHDADIKESVINHIKSETKRNGRA